MEFCPFCANMLLCEMHHSSTRLFCPTCPYICNIEGKIKRRMRLRKKPVDPIFSEADRVYLNKTTSVSCPECNHGEASFTQVQTRSADEPMTIFYVCTKCKHTWTEN
ncbi:uncharacterized protein LOC127256340 [Andrographis paniculata]|uniref:uncharacterized protein LOC127256340 n=1 Tax=Andrographis paniculata TaxID=175694 RepID=UPI0021E90B02|nr:uncharacterized protein LOC127256340 [Andrographis paniculata]XP_051138269.1 uncharacterized protein LOC127256340 [Andrographis paniculata]XP_051138270.1 uncharacterized protein LOC127256340 [Andrographis paniculata]